MIAQADAKDWSRGHQFQCVLNALYGLGTHGWISRTIAQEQPIPFNLGRIGLEIVVKWNYCQLDFVSVHEETDDVEFHSAIVGNDMWGVVGAIGSDGFGRNFSNEIALVWVGEDFVG